MRVAFLLLAHKDPVYIERTVRALSMDGDEVFIHIDRTVDITPFKSRLARIAQLVGERYGIAWGGFNMVQATNALLETAVQQGSFDYFYLLSGQCFPIKSLSWLKNELASGMDYIECRPMPQPGKPMARLEARQINLKMFDFRGIRNGIKGPRFRVKRIIEKIINLPEVPDFQARFGLSPYAGSQWWCLRRDTVGYIRTYRRNHPQYDKFMKWTGIPDEMYYHTIVANGPTPERIAGSLTAANWTEGNASPDIIRREDLPGLLSRKAFMARKFQTDDFDLLDDLQELRLS